MSKTGASNITNKSRSICGYPALQLDYDKSNPTVPNEPSKKTKLLSVIAPIGDKTFNILVNVQFVHADNPSYVADASSMLDGLQIQPVH